MKLSEDVKNILKSIKDSLWIKNHFESPKLEKVIVAIGIWSLATRKWMKDFSEIENNLKKITWQKPCMILSKKSISNFKLRDGMPSMLKVTLRWQKAYDFLNKTAKVVMPRIRDFEWMSNKSFDKCWWYSFGLKSYSVFPELTPDDVNLEIWLQVSITTTSSNVSFNKKFLEFIWFVFKSKM